MNNRHLEGIAKVGVLFVVVFTVSSVVTGFVVSEPSLGTGGASVGTQTGSGFDDTSLQNGTDRANAVVDDPGRVARAYNEHVDRVPAVLEERTDSDRKQRLALEAYASLRANLADEVIEFRIRTADGDVETYTVWTDEDAYIVRYRTGGSDVEPGVTVVTDETTIERIAASNDRPAAVVDAVEADDINVRGAGLDGFMLERSLKLYAELR